MDVGIFIVVVGALYIVTRLLLAMLTRELRTRVQDNYRFIGPLVAPLHWVLLLASVLIGMSLIGRETGRIVLFFDLAIAWFVFRLLTIILFEWWFATIKSIHLPGVARRLISLALATAALLAFLRFGLDVGSGDLAILTAVIGVIVAIFFQGFLRDLFLGISLVLEKRIAVGDWVSIDGHYGQVVALDWRSATLHNDRNERIVLPNRRVAEVPVIHVGREPRRQVMVEIVLSAEVSPSAVLKELALAVAQTPQVLAEPPPKVLFCGERAGENRFEVSFWIPETIDGDLLRSDVRTAVWYRLRRAGLIAHHAVFELPLEVVHEALAKLPLLGSATPAQIEKLAEGVRTARYGKGELLFRQNDRGDELFLIFAGALDIFLANGRNAEQKIASVGTGNFVGERSLLTGEARSATVRAAEDCTVFVIGKRAMGELLHDDPEFAEQIAQVMEKREKESQKLTQDFKGGTLDDPARSMLKRIRDFFALD